MNRERTVGTVLTGLSVLGYVVGVVAPYPGRSATIIGVMVGVTLAAVGTGGDGA